MLLIFKKGAIESRFVKQLQTEKVQKRVQKAAFTYRYLSLPHHSGQQDPVRCIGPRGRLKWKFEQLRSSNADSAAQQELWLLLEVSGYSGVC